MSAAVETVAACLTPPGAAAIATLALHGPEAWSILRSVFRPVSKSGRLLPEQPEAGRVWVGRCGDALVDEVVLTVKRVEPVPWVELHSHGGREVVQLLLETLQSRGARLGSWQDFEQRTTGDALQSAAAAALARATTSRTAAILLDQYQGALRRAVTELLAVLERPGVEEEAQRLLAELARYVDVGRHLPDGWRVVIAGAPNVGKSSLVNALAGYQRSVVSPTPGTTRDVVTIRLALDGWPVELADTAGLRTDAAALEAEGIHRARAAVEEADLCLWVLDASQPPVWPTFEKVRLIINKIDLPAAWDLNEAAGALRVSAQTGEGLAELCQAMAGWLVPDPPPPGAAVPFTAVLVDCVETAVRHGLSHCKADLQRL